MPRKNKGERVVVTGRLPASYYRKLDHHVKATDETKTSFITEAVMKALDQLDSDTVHPEQQRLELPA